MQILLRTYMNWISYREYKLLYFICLSYSCHMNENQELALFLLIALCTLEWNLTFVFHACRIRKWQKCSPFPPIFFLKFYCNVTVHGTSHEPMKCIERHERRRQPTRDENKLCLFRKKMFVFFRFPFLIRCYAFSCGISRVDNCSGRQSTVDRKRNAKFESLKRHAGRTSSIDFQYK